MKNIKNKTFGIEKNYFNCKTNILSDLIPSNTEYVMIPFQPNCLRL